MRAPIAEDRQPPSEGGRGGAGLAAGKPRRRAPRQAEAEALSAPSPLGRRAADLVRHTLATCPPGVSIGEAARRMVAADTDALVVVDEAGRPLGICTDADMRRRVVASGASLARPVSAVASSPVVALAPEALGLDAVEAMLRHGIHHVVLLDARGWAAGVLSDGDLLSVEAERPLLLARRIEHADSVEELRQARATFPRTVRMLLDSGASAEQVGRILAETEDRVARRLLQLAQRELGAAPGPFCWLAMGSEGRREQTLATDQDNGLIYADGLGPAADRAFERLAEWMVEALATCGAARCVGNVMATNPRWRGPLAAWQAHLGQWLANPEPSHLLDVLIAFDFRAVGGDTRMGVQLRSWLAERTPRAPTFLAQVAHAALESRRPLGLLGQFVLSRDGTFDVKRDALRPVVDGLRLLALEHGWPVVGTVERLDQARAAGVLPREDARDLRAAFEALQRLRLRHQLELVEAGQPPNNALAPKAIQRAERAGLREHLKTIGRFQDGLRGAHAATLRGF